MNIETLKLVTPDVVLGQRVRINAFVNLYGCRIGDDCMIGTFVEIQKDVVLGARCRVQSHSFLCSGVTVGDDVFIGHGVIFINDRHPSAPAARRGDWVLSPCRVGDRASIGSGALVFGDVEIGADAVIGAGAVVTRDVPAGATVMGVPARLRPAS